MRWESSLLPYLLTQILPFLPIQLLLLQFLLPSQFEISPPSINQLLVRPPLHNPPPFHKINHIRLLNSTQSVRNS